MKKNEKISLAVGEMTPGVNLKQAREVASIIKADINY
jgi:hypothetical protein